MYIPTSNKAADMSMAVGKGYKKYHTEHRSTINTTTYVRKLVLHIVKQNACSKQIGPAKEPLVL